MRGIIEIYQQSFRLQPLLDIFHLHRLHLINGFFFLVDQPDDLLVLLVSESVGRISPVFVHFLEIRAFLVGLHSEMRDFLSGLGSEIRDFLIFFRLSEYPSHRGIYRSRLAVYPLPARDPRYGYSFRL